MDEKKTVEIVNQGGVSVISFGASSISGVSGVDEVSRELREFIATSQPEKVVVDFSGVKFFSSQMLGLLIDMWRKLESYGAVMLISGINPQLGRVFRITNLDRIFKFYPDKESALDAMNKKED